jgi:hypothetical protein
MPRSGWDDLDEPQWKLGAALSREVSASLQAAGSDAGDVLVELLDGAATSLAEGLDEPDYAYIDVLMHVGPIQFGEAAYSRLHRR